MTPLEAYLRSVGEIHGSGAGVKETSYYPALSNLLNEVGKKLKPRVRCIMSLANRGAGLPDGGLFTPDQFPKSSPLEPLTGQLPGRGAIEVKSPGEDASVTAASDQVSKYCKRYKQVLVTNLRDFALVGRDSEGSVVKLESYLLAKGEKEFWALAGTPRRTDDEHGERFVEFLKRVMLHAAELSAPEDVAWFLASYAREAKGRIEGVDLPALAGVRSALEEALGLKFEGEKGEHFFRSSLIQTLFYGVFSAWVLWSKQHPPTSKDRFDWYTTARYLRVPMISKIFHLVADPQELEALKLTEVLGWATLVLNRVDRRSFFDRFQESNAVQYFYEPFLEAFDPELRKELGVWYTPPEIVKYMVERVDTVLREELRLPLGLADKNVYVLDPCCGTGSYLVEVLDRVHRALKERGEDGLLASDLKDAARNRVFGFEILPAPFVVSHLQLGLLLQKIGAPLSEAKKERAAVYLTNSLTGWEPPKGPKQRLMFPELEEERDAAEHVKRDVPILVIIGNPPYNSFAGIAAMEEERDLTQAYRTTKRAAAPQGQGLNDLYVRFYRMAERRIVEKTGRGVVCLISNYSWLDGLSFTGMRERYLEAFDRIWVDCLNGDKYRTGKLTPDGEPDPSVFSTEWNPEGIQVGTAIALLVRAGDGGPKSALLRFRNLWGKTKRAQLLETATQHGDSLYQRLSPALEIGLPFMPSQIALDYSRWPLLTDLFPVSFPGVKTSRDPLVVDIDHDRLTERMEHYFDPEVSYEEMRRICPVAMTKASRFDPKATRNFLLGRGFLSENVVRYCYRPFDFRWIYWEPKTKLLDEKREEYFPHVYEGNLWLGAVQQNRKIFDPPQVSRRLCSLHVIERGANLFPIFLRDDRAQGTLEAQGRSATASRNLTSSAQTYLGSMDVSAQDLFHHAISVLHAPSYRAENLAALRQDWPRIPLPNSKKAILASAALGRQIAALLDVETPTEATDQRSLQRIGVFRLVEKVPLVESKHFALTAGWGHAGKGGVTMPGTGKMHERDYTVSELGSIGENAKLLGRRTIDVYLNDSAYWENVPLRVWEYTIGGYQVIKKWLSYREEKLLGRPLTKGEVRYVQEMARRISAIILLEPALDRNYGTAKEHAHPWKSLQPVSP